MTALIVFGGIILFFLLILLPSIVIYVKIDEKVDVSFGALGYKKSLSFENNQDADNEEDSSDVKPKKKKKKSKKKQSKLDQAAKKVTDEKANENSFFQTVDMVLAMIKLVFPSAGKLLSHIRFTKVKVLMTVVSSSADKTAIKYGYVSAGIYTLLKTLDTAFILKTNQISIMPDYISEKAKYNIYFKVKLRVLFIVIYGVKMLFSVVFFFVKKLLNKNQTQSKA